MHKGRIFGIIASNLGVAVAAAALACLATFGAACSSSSGGGTGGAGTGGEAPGTGGAAAGTGGEAPGTGGAAAGTGGQGGSAFMGVAPCPTAASYQAATGATATVMFGAALTYTPACLKVAPGTAVTFMGDAASESFAKHPLFPSDVRGTLTGNPITMKADTATSATFTFPTRGSYAYYCVEHGNDDGIGMTGVVWVD